MSQFVFWEIRRRLILGLINASFRKVRFLKDEIYSALTSDVNNITNASLVTISFASSLILVFASFVYLAYLSFPLFLLTVVTVILGMVVYAFNIKSSNIDFVNVRNLEQEFMKGFNGVLDGNKEIKLNYNKGWDVYNIDVLPLTKEGERLNTIAYVRYLNNQLVSQLLFYVLIVLILLVFFDSFNLSVDIVVSFVFALLFLLGPLVSIVTSIPTLHKALISYRKLIKIRDDLDFKDPKEVNISMDPILPFRTMSIIGYKFSYGDGAFSIGPMDMDVRANEILFLYGANGSGKTTFINTILTLYFPDQGELKLNGKRVPRGQLKTTRGLFSPVFSDFFLFDKFYGIGQEVDSERIIRLFDLFDLDHSVRNMESGILNTDLSTGQRKRLALIGAILEDRPILVLDEWAADQDPHFRNKFYTDIIHRIVEEEDKTIIAITHDDKYFVEADRVYKMDYGILTEVDYMIKI